MVCVCVCGTGKHEADHFLFFCILFAKDHFPIISYAMRSKNFF